MSDIDTDTLQRFVFENTAIRGEIVRLNASYLAILSKHDYPPSVRKLLGEALAIAALLSTTLKTDGIITLQIQAAGPITLMVAQANSLNQLRGLAHWTGEVSTESLTTAFGEGHLIITIDPGSGSEKFQGIVQLAGQNLAEALVHYFQQSEQIKTHLYLASDENSIAGILLQALPKTETHYDDIDLLHQIEQTEKANWETIVHLTSTLTPEEILQLPNRDILRRLYLTHDEDIRLFDGERLSFQCSCSRERMEGALKLLDESEILEILKEKEAVVVTCEFCNQQYKFDSIDFTLLFSNLPAAVESNTKH